MKDRGVDPKLLFSNEKEEDINFSAGDELKTCVHNSENLQNWSVQNLVNSNFIQINSVDKAKIKDVEHKILVNKEEQLNILKRKFGSVFSNKLDYSKVSHDIEFEVELDPNIPYIKPYCYPLPNHYREAAKDKIDDLLAQGILQHSKSNYASPVVCAVKKDGSVRVCGDYRNINVSTVPDQYTIPRIDYIKQNIRGNIFTSLDLKEGFHQIPIKKEHMKFTAIATPWGLMEYTRMPFGLKNAPPTFQRFLNIVLQGISNVFVYIDDLIIYSDSFEEHLVHLYLVFQRLSKYGLIVNEKKCSFFTQKLIYLGLEFGPDGYRPVVDTLPKINNYPIPVNRKQVLKFLGIINYYRTHIPNLAEIAAPLYELLQSGKRFKWSTEQQKAFEELKLQFEKRLVLAPLRSDGELSLYTDASGVALGAVLLQDNQPVEFYSRKLNKAEQRYSAYEREMMAMVSAILHFRTILLGRKFTLYTDHRPLLNFRKKMPDNERQSRWMVKLQDLDFDIVYIEGEHNVLADLMSRPAGVERSSIQELYDEIINAVSLVILTDELKKAQTPEFINICKKKLPDSVFKKIGGFCYVEENGNLLLLVPPDFQQQIIREVHNRGHYGRKRTNNIIKSQYYWPYQKKSVDEFVRGCQQCQLNKVRPKIPRNLVKFPKTDRFRTVHIDIVGPMERSKRGSLYIVTMMDRFSRWLEAVPVRNITATNIAIVFYKNWVCRFGVPDNLISDQGTQFESYVFKETLNRLGITRCRTTAYHPQTNGILERSHAVIKSMLRTLGDRFPDWEDALPSVLLAMRTAIGSNDVSPSLVVYGEQLCIPTHLVEDKNISLEVEEDLPHFLDNIEKELVILREYIYQTDDTLRGPTEDNPDITFLHEYVYIKDPILRGSLQPKFLGPFRVVDFDFPVVTYRYKNELKKVNMDRTRPAHKIPLYEPTGILPDTVTLPQHELESLDRLEIEIEEERRLQQIREQNRTEERITVPDVPRILTPENVRPPAPQPAQRQFGPRGGYITRFGRESRPVDRYQA